MRKIILVILAALLLNGCAVTRDGVKLGAGSSGSQKEVDEIKNRLASNTAKAMQDELMTGAIQTPENGILVIGELGPFRSLDESDLKDEYKNYIRIAEKFHKNVPAEFTEAEFIRQFSGWTSVEVWGIPTIANRRQNAMVPRNLAENLNYSYTVTSSLFGTTGDLVLCKSNKDGIFYVDQLLCKEDDSDCAKEYKKGVYEINTGRELSYNYKLLNNKIKINPKTYKFVMQ